MLKNRTLVIGLGVGLMLGAMLVQMMNAVTLADPKAPVQPGGLKPDELDAKQLKEAAAKYYQVFPKEEQVFSQSQVDALVQKRVAEEKTKLSAGSPAAPARKTYIYIASGLNSVQVAEMLYQSSLITDRKAFEDEMNRQKLNGKILAGVHAFEGQPDMAQVIANITGS